MHYDDDGNPISMTINPVTFSVVEAVADIEDKEAIEEIVRSMERAIKTFKKYSVFEPPKEWSKKENDNE